MFEQPRDNPTHPERDERRRFEAIECADILPEQKLDLALLLLHRKSAAQLGAYDVIEDEAHLRKLEAEFSQNIASIRSLLDELGLVSKLSGPVEDRGVYGFSFLIAPDAITLERVTRADESKDDRAFGLLMGYPETSVTAYNTKDAMGHEELPKEELVRIRGENLEHFLRFTLSRAHWRDELEEVRKNQRLLKEKAPRLFQELIRHDPQSAGEK